MIYHLRFRAQGLLCLGTSLGLGFRVGLGLSMLPENLSARFRSHGRARGLARKALLGRRCYFAGGAGQYISVCVQSPNPKP